MGVRTRAHAHVTAITADGVTIKTATSEEHIPCKTVLWAAGVRASKLGKILADATGAPSDKAGRVTVEPDCTIKGNPEIYVVGDLQIFTHQTGKPLPGVAQTAIQGGSYAAKAILKKLRGQPVQPFHYWDKGNLAVIGRLSGVADLHAFQLSGAPAWFVWLFIHVLYLVGFDNRVTVLIEWAFNYFTHNRSARLITGAPPVITTGAVPVPTSQVSQPTGV